MESSLTTSNPPFSLLSKTLLPHYPPRFSSFPKLKKQTLSLNCCKSPNANNNNNNNRKNPFHILSPLIKTIKGLVKSYKTDTAAFCPKNLNVNSGLGLGIALLSVTASAKVKISPFVATLSLNKTFVSGVLGWMFAQCSKMVINFFVERKWDWSLVYASGGMPSSHSALCMALTTSVALVHGVADSLFPVCLGFSLIVMYDAIGVRRHAGMQAEVLNLIIRDLFEGHPISQRKLKELLGHTPSQVLVGALVGIVVACFCCQSYLVTA